MSWIFGGDEIAAGQLGVDRDAHLMEDFAPQFGLHLHGTQQDHDVTILHGTGLFGMGIEDIELGFCRG